MVSSHKEIYRQTLDWVKEARQLIQKYMARGSIYHESKSHINDLVTEVDRAVERFFVERIQQTYPDHQIVGEEGIVDIASTHEGFVWYIDPIDGTSNFVSQQRDFTISIALYYHGEAVFGIIDDVMQQSCYHICKGGGCYLNDQPLNLQLRPTRLLDSLLAISLHFTSEQGLHFGKQLIEIGPRIRGIRSYGAATISLLRVALGQIQGYMVSKLSPWDIAAGKMFVEEAGGVVTDFTGQAITLEQSTTLLACHPSMQNELLAFIKQLPPYGR